MQDTIIKELIEKEAQRQNDEICLIASENYTSKDVREAQGSIFTNKYAEGYPGHRYYGGCEFVDDVENEAIYRVCKLFGASNANVQPHSGSQANQAVYAALLKPGDRVLAMDLNSGAHITHVSKASYTSKIYKTAYYGLNKDDTINLSELKEKLNTFYPHLLIVGGSSYPREINYARIREILDEYNADKPMVKCGEDVDIEDRTVYPYQFEIPKCLMMVDMAHVAGLVAAGFHQNPVPYADVVTSTTHKTLRGPRGGFILTNNDEIAKKIDTAVFPRTQGGPLMHVIAGKAICFGEASTNDFKVYVGKLLSNRLVMQKVFEERGFKMVSGGSDTHMIVLDLRTNPAYRVMTGKRAEDLLSFCGIITNKNTIPGDTRPKSETSGLRIGTAAITTRGFTVEDCERLANVICDILILGDKITGEQRTILRDWVSFMCKKYPLTNI